MTVGGNTILVISAGFVTLAIIGGGLWRLISAILKLVNRVDANIAAIDRLTHELEHDRTQLADHERRLIVLEARR